MLARGGLAANPFGEKPVPRWRSLLRPGKGGAPKRYAAPAGALGSLSGLVLQSGDGLDKPTRFAIIVALTLIPPFLVERWWKGRERRQEERLLVLPD
jgi:hypothetical protein